MLRALRDFFIIVGVIVLALAAIAVYEHLNNSTSPDTASAASASPTDIESSAPACQSGWTQRSATVYFLNPEGCGSPKLVLSSGKTRLEVGLINQFTDSCEKYNVDGVAYDSIKTVAADINGVHIQLTRSCVNGDELFTPNTDSDSVALFAAMNADKSLTITLGKNAPLHYKNPDYLKAADNLIAYGNLNP